MGCTTSKCEWACRSRARSSGIFQSNIMVPIKKWLFDMVNVGHDVGVAADAEYIGSMVADGFIERCTCARRYVG